MREKRLWLVVTFPATTAAMAMEILCEKAGLPGRLIPVPREITAGCGMAWLRRRKVRPSCKMQQKGRTFPWMAFIG